MHVFNNKMGIGSAMLEALKCYVFNNKMGIGSAMLEALKCMYSTTKWVLVVLC